MEEDSHALMQINKNADLPANSLSRTLKGKFLRCPL